MDLYGHSRRWTEFSAIKYASEYGGWLKKALGISSSRKDSL